MRITPRCGRQANAATPAKSPLHAHPRQPSRGCGVERRLGRGAAPCRPLPNSSFEARKTPLATSNTMVVSA